MDEWTEMLDRLCFSQRHYWEIQIAFVASAVFTRSRAWLRQLAMRGHKLIILDSEIVDVQFHEVTHCSMLMNVAASFRVSVV